MFWNVSIHNMKTNVITSVNVLECINTYNMKTNVITSVNVLECINTYMYETKYDHSRLIAEIYI